MKEMKNFVHTAVAAFAFVLFATADICSAQIASKDDYLEPIRQEFVKRWPESRTVNFVFHGHSVPAGYARTPLVNTLDAYPYQTLVTVKRYYPNAILNTITTAIGGENSEQGSVRFEAEVLTHRPDVLFIDYGLNDRTIGVERSEKAWRSMIEKALERGIKVILCTPTPDLSARMSSPEDPLTLQAEMVRHLAAEYHTGLADFYAEFNALAERGEKLSDYMAQVNHPNARGHQVAEAVIARWILTPEQYSDFVE